MIFLLTIEYGSDREKLVSIYNQYKKMIMTIAYDILKDYHEAEDAMQSVIVKISYHLNCINEVSSQKTKGFIIQITKNHCFDVYNKRKKIVLEAEIFDPEVNDVDEAFLYESTIGDETISELTKSLKREYAEILTLTHYQELTVKEIADVLKISEGNVSVRLNRAHNAMRRLIKERKIGDADVN